ncbi:MAG: hypothetical protein J0H92_12455 [Sphingobacteriales bacterium]|nr:hypothetical protein [Sphingobacteriales bacterium]NCT76243.1 hypothetical protein [Chitinophagaceae bacterium]OJW33839.1 MAG: hypothetical protein BGO54_11500 [Sphingobacteriales bacterium 46-32]
MQKYKGFWIGKIFLQLKNGDKIPPTWYCIVEKTALSLYRFFIGYWILKTGLDVYPGPFSFLKGSAFKILYSYKGYKELKKFKGAKEYLEHPLNPLYFLNSLYSSD